MRLKELRKNEKLLQEDIAKILNTTQATYSRYELGISDVPTDVLCKLADFYRVSLDYLIDRQIPNNFTQENNIQQATINKYLSLSESSQIKVAGYVDSLVESEKNKS